MSDTSLVFALSTRDNTAAGMRSARQTVQDESEAMADDVGESGTSAASSFGENLKAGAAAAMVAVGAVVVAGFAEALDQGQIVGKLQAQLGATTEDAKKYGDIAGNLYADAVTEDFQGAADTIGAVMGSGLMKPDATNAQIESISTKVADLANTFDQELGGVTNAVAQLMRTGLAKNSTEALDLIAQGFTTSANKADDFLDTLNEYSVQFKRVGLDGKTAIGLIDQAIKGGARDSDQVADAIGQFGELAIAGGSNVEAAFKSIGLNADDVATKLKKGGKSGQEALQMTTDALRNTTDKQTRLNAATALFGDPGTVMGDALLALDPASAAASSGMDKAAGAAGRTGDALRDNAGTAVKQFQRHLQQGLVDFLGGTVIPAMDGFRKHVGTTFSNLWADAAKGSGGGFDQVLNLFPILGQKILQKIAEMAPKAIDGLISFGGKVADFIVANPTKVLKIGAIAAALTLAIVALPLLVGAAISAAAAMMMIGFAQKLVTGINDNLPKWWAAFTGWISAKASQAGTFFAVLGIAIAHWFGGLWSRYVAAPVGRFGVTFIGWVSGLPGRAVAALSGLGGRLAGSASAGFQRFRDAAAVKAASFIGWVGGMPGRISGAVGSLKNLLYDKGRNVVSGLWRGIQSMGGWLRSTLIGWAKSVIPGPIAEALHIGSPAKLLADEIGHWIPPGIAMGAEDNRGVLDDTMRGLVDPQLAAPRAPLTTGMAPLMGAQRGGSTMTLLIKLDGPESVKRLIREIVAIDGGGNVQHAFGG